MLNPLKFSINKDPFRAAKSLAHDAVRRAIETVDFSVDPPLSVPDKYKHMVWFALPSDIIKTTIEQMKTGVEVVADVNQIPFIPDDAKVRK